MAVMTSHFEDEQIMALPENFSELVASKTLCIAESQLKMLPEN